MCSTGSVVGPIAPKSGVLTTRPLRSVDVHVFGLLEGAAGLHRSNSCAVLPHRSYRRHAPGLPCYEGIRPPLLYKLATCLESENVWLVKCKRMLVLSVVDCRFHVCVRVLKEQFRS